VVLENDIGGDVYQLTLPSKSVFGEGEPNKWPLQMYAKMLGSKGVPITSVVTEMRFDTDSSTPKITFKPARFLEQDEFAKAIDQGKSDAAVKAITMTVAQTDGVDSKAAFETPKLEAKVEPKAEEPEAEAVEEVKEPVKRASKKEEAPAPKKNIADILDEWDD
jgi:FtsZ-interacting cell division protein ZipA